jgi:tRNA modification GTPase
MDTIVAPMTPMRKSGVILLRVSGDAALALQFFEIKKPLKPRAATQAIFHSRAEPRVTDSVLLTLFPSPNSYTGEDVLEISFHGNPLIAHSAIIDFLSVGMRRAERGEFTKRALLNQKTTLSQAEAVERLASARTPAGVDKAAAALSGRLNDGLNLIYDRIIDALSLIEASIDFAEDVEDETPFFSDYKEDIEVITAELKGFTDGYRSAKKALEGERVVIAGKVNAGKSTLFNALVGEAASIVTEEEGTTRDLITKTAHIGGIDFVLTDTAGFREAESAAEREGVLRAEAAVKDADIVLWIQSPDDEATQPTLENAIIVGSKADLYKADLSAPQNRFDISVSAKTGLGMDKLKELIEKKLLPVTSERELDLITDRQYEEALEAVKETENALLSPTHDIAAFHLTRAAERVMRAEGKGVAEAALDAIFSKFCIGK